MVDAVVVGAGPNGLAAAVILARAGLAVEVHEAGETVGGGCRTAELTLPGYRHDVCAGAHPMAAASPFFRAFDLAAHGVELLAPEISYAHPLDGGGAGLAWRDLDRTVAGLGRDGAAWRRLFGPLVREWQELVALAMSDLRHPPLRAATGVRFGLRLLEQASPLWGMRFRDEVAPAMLTGIAAHAIIPPRAFSAAGVALLLGSLAHVDGWVIPRGGSQAIADALAAEIEKSGGRIVTGSRVDSLDEFRGARTILLDTAPAELLRLAGDRLPAGYAARLGRVRYGGAACKVDFALSGPVPWRAPGCASAGTLHVVGTRAEAVAAERAVAAGHHADRPYVLVVQPDVVDDTRAPQGGHTLYAYAHVPNGSTRDVSDTMIAQLERFAPGVRDLILARHVRTAAEMPFYNANYIGGDISAGAMTMRQTIFRPTPRWNPYSTPLPGVYLCSASTPPGPGVHGMSGLHAARHALHTRFGITEDPLALLRRTAPKAAP
ncbi:NAD(P)/FAD-dependent oxidoreductase [Nocardia sp. NEAU-G5]|uniref:Pyridine nucleotide-disulfide oxidoreductase domain-containing protein 2 n=1 Tax=Nocardia albiluteola TaxID=2842303 RepID=A0ABS6AZF8_9NOCA|nr:NAD(P)/FAD-dependent oxidoreductase [Nocardia albiluteola]MBU3063438.1 NAD(P)/FAD-dependent oxidoreductase [Nocardia albiluteola]